MADSRPGKKERLALRREQALALRLGGATYRQIASALNVSVRTAHKDVQLTLRAHLALSDGDAERLRQIELERLDTLTRTLWAQAMGDRAGGIAPDMAAMDRILRIMKQRAALLGLEKQEEPQDSTLNVIVSYANQSKSGE